MPNEPYSKTLSKLTFKSQAVEANIGEVPHLRGPLDRLIALQGRAGELVAKQAALTAAKQEVSKELAELISEGRKLMTFLDAGLRLHYGNRSEKLTAFGQQPFRGLPARTRLVGPDGRPVTSEEPDGAQE
jgi:hypothetical protein